jgi:hypothetical protein
MIDYKIKGILMSINIKKITAPNYSEASFASKTTPLCNDVFREIAFYLEPRDTACVRQVCKSWNQFLQNIWRGRCHAILGIPLHIDPKELLPQQSSYAGGLCKVLSSVIDGEFLRHLGIGVIEKKPPISKALYLKKWSQPDPCDPDKIIGRNYILINVPEEDVEITNPSGEKIRMRLTINNLPTIFAGVQGNSPQYAFGGHRLVIQQHGDKPILCGWFWMRKDVIGKNLSFPDQEKLAKDLGVDITDLTRRLFINCAYRRAFGSYLDKIKPFTYARTLTRTSISPGRDNPSCCGAGDTPFGLHATTIPPIGYDFVGVGVELPAEVQAI